MYLSQELENETLVLRFPELPEEIELKYDIDNKKHNVLSLGDVIRIGKKGLKSFTLKAYYPADSAPEIYEAIVERMVENEKPVRFILNKTEGAEFLGDINISVVFDSIAHKEVGGETGDIYFTYKFTEHREHEARVIDSV